MKRLLCKRKLQKGSGEFIGFSISMVGLCSFLVFFIGFYLFFQTTLAMENAANLVGRDVVVCESLEEAEELAQDGAETLLSGYQGLENIRAYVDYTPGSDEEWKKGNFITVTIMADMTFSVPMVDSTKTVTNVVMIERSEE